LLNFSWT